MLLGRRRAGRRWRRAPSGAATRPGGRRGDALRTPRRRPGGAQVQMQARGRGAGPHGATSAGGTMSEPQPRPTRGRGGPAAVLLPVQVLDVGPADRRSRRRPLLPRKEGKAGYRRGAGFVLLRPRAARVAVTWRATVDERAPRELPPRYTAHSTSAPDALFYLYQSHALHSVGLYGLRHAAGRWRELRGSCRGPRRSWSGCLVEVARRRRDDRGA